jgi:transcriptional regulator with XRE-family HTH domain
MPLLSPGNGQRGEQQTPRWRPAGPQRGASLDEVTEQAGSDLREFLRTRRARVGPQEAGLPPQMGPRRVPGLRREEVALLAGISAEYYERFERGRTKNVSAAVLDAVARVLRLDDTERDHLYALASPARTKRVALPPQRVRPGLRRALDTLDDVPALVLGRRTDILAANALARAFYTDFDALPASERNMLRFLFTDDSARDLYHDWAATAQTVVAGLRAYAGTHPHDPQLAELVGDLSVRDHDFRRWWADHDVYVRDHGTKRYHHPLVGELELGYEAFTPVGETDMVFGIHTAEPGSASENALRLLATWTTQDTSAQ